MSSEAPPPGWYPDPAQRHYVRWWSGTEWTDHVGTHTGEASTDPLHPAVPDTATGAAGVPGAAATPVAAGSPVAASTPMTSPTAVVSDAPAPGKKVPKWVLAAIGLVLVAVVVFALTRGGSDPFTRLKSTTGPEAPTTILTRPPTSTTGPQSTTTTAPKATTTTGPKATTTTGPKATTTTAAPPHT